jgi:mono/diheme cytochrome c family protein
MPLLTREDFLAPSPVDPSKTIAERALSRMRDPLAPMPPSGQLAPEQVEAFAAWLAAGLPERSCAATDAGAPDAGPAELTCSSDNWLPTPLDDGSTASDFMAPGMACIACHLGLNFAGQNPLGLTHGEHVYDFMGTVFAAPHERDLCAPRLPTDATVEILSVDGGLVVRLPVNAGGNFQGNAPAGKPSAFRARLVTAAGARAMGVGQASGDCNTCHTAEGREGAPGRIFLP